MSAYDSEDKVIYTDFEISKYHIWECYNGFKTFYMNWSMSERAYKTKHYLELGVKKYAEEFLIQIKNFLGQAKLVRTMDSLDIEKAKGFLASIKTGSFNPSPSDLKFLRLFAEDFLFSTGMKDIVKDVGIPQILRG